MPDGSSYHGPHPFDPQLRELLVLVQDGNEPAKIGSCMEASRFKFPVDPNRRGPFACPLTFQS